MKSTTNVIPEQGQIVTVRQRPFVVTDVLASNLPPCPLAPTSPKQHLLTLTSIEDDALGETLQVIWEVEPGAKVSENVSLPGPVGFDAPERLEAFLNAVRWGAIATADSRALQAPFRSGIEIEDYLSRPASNSLGNQMWDKFSLDFRIVDRDLMKELCRSHGIHVNP